MTPEQRVYDGDRAREVLDNEVFQQVFADLATEITEQWKKSPARDEAGRHELWLMQSLLSKLQTMLQTTLDTGKLARLDLEHKRTLAQKARNWAGL
jgi:hypothetical protein